MTWIVRHGHIGDAFFDVDVSRFLVRALGDMAKTRQEGEPAPSTSPAAVPPTPPGPRSSGSEAAARIERQEGRQQVAGHAVGPEWVRMVAAARGAGSEVGEAAELTIHYGVELTGVRDAPLPSTSTYVCDLSNGAVADADVVVCAVGVVPATQWLQRDKFDLAPDGALVVDRRMRTSAPEVWAAGDACAAGWDPSETPHWFQMRLWTQAYAMGAYAARCMAAAAGTAAPEGDGEDRGGAPSALPEEPMDFAFELFAHATRFFGFKVVLLGLYDAQKLEGEPEADLVSYCRETRATFVRVLLLRGRMQGAVLIGETGLEETMENLILNGLDLSSLGPSLLDPDIDIEDYFD